MTAQERNAADQNKLVAYKVDGSEIRLSASIVKRYLVSGDANAVTDQEVTVFVELCRYQKLNPFLRDAYLIKYGSEPASIVVGKDVFVKRAQRNPSFRGMEFGVVVRNTAGLVEYRVGGLVLKGEELVGGWTKVYHQAWDKPVTVVVNLSEYIRYRKKDGQVRKTWREMPATMIQKVALAQALRSVFPEDLRGLYDEAEMQLPEEVNLSACPVNTGGDDSVTVIDAETVEVKDVNPVRPGAAEATRTGCGPTVVEAEPDVRNITVTGANGLEALVNVSLQLGKTQAEEIKGCVFRTAMLYGEKHTGVVVLGVKGQETDSFKKLPGGRHYACDVAPLSPEALKKVKFKGSLKDYNGAAKYWVVSELQEVQARGKKAS